MEATSIEGDGDFGFLLKLSRHCSVFSLRPHDL